MTKTKSRSPSIPSGVFMPGTNLTDYLEQRGDLRALFDRVHAHFFESLGVGGLADETPRRSSGTRSRSKGETHAQSHSR
ncbi:MAG: hypothetical protein IPP35_00170 [Elusimicrobia bacterium]|nr:hypothetical protein [Elusimicrobiota bacterium]